MAYKTIVAVLHDEETATRALDAASALAARWDSHLIGVHAEPLPMPIASPMGFPDATIMTTEDELGRERAEKLGTIFAARMEREAISHEWRAVRSFSGDSALSALEMARCADLVVAAQTPDGGASGTPDIETLIQSGGRPVLVVPPAGPASIDGRRIVLAWNGSRQSARAAFDALDFIVAAEETFVLTVNPVENPGEAGPLPGSEIAAALARHGARVTVENIRSGDRSVARTMSDFVAEKRADCLILGAFSHSRIKEMLFGGTTRTMLTAPPCATLFAR